MAFGGGLLIEKGEKLSDLGGATSNNEIADDMTQFTGGEENWVGPKYS